MQDVFLSLFRHVQLGRPRTNLRGWLFRVAHNLALKQRLRTKRRQAVETADARPKPQDRQRTETRACSVASLERRQRLLAVFRALPERDRR